MKLILALCVNSLCLILTDFTFTTTIMQYFNFYTEKSNYESDQIIGIKSIDADFGLDIFVDIVAINFEYPIIFNDLNKEFNIDTDGIKNRGFINTGRGSDQIIGLATANLSAIAITVFEGVALAEISDTAIIGDLFTSIKLNATTDGIDNYCGIIHTGKGNDHIYGIADASIAAVAIADVDISAIADVTCNYHPENLTAFAEVLAVSLAQVNIIASGINNSKGQISTGKGDDIILGQATSISNTLSDSFTNTFATATPENQAFAEAVANAIAEAKDTAIAINNTKGLIITGKGDDIIIANAEANNKAIALNNTQGLIFTGTGDDTIIANATGNESDGIFGGHIYMGSGSDTLETSSFGGGVNINMGRGADFVTGFGNATIDGGRGFDILSLGNFKIEDFHISLGTGHNEVIFQKDGIMMTTCKFEQFIFNDDSLILNYHELASL
jgi:hypothetical protein